MLEYNLKIDYLFSKKYLNMKVVMFKMKVIVGM